ncbi:MULTISPECIES: AbrB/MazE/SpoVT family DNA-binding domain-containing protein [Pectobacterium]|uniref:AbrB/MazE/SpoVT family DNA-binding domain-containing protein n=1 Tax=Pectobacterium TaxID=122277 RepID=UPI001874BB8F|nr:MULTISPECIES: AbrB/MazE/SpoVT family DNA-binding domain-containing protein [Pectobacterium]MBE5214781.1 AbrB/MazE/SpoVT family DNA-binding domain-containing protein [Pectobacterium quasiaquaticum]MBE5224820.1 AbrB/MazE/SpoVT family DNA-binding domain-containing protein [Pectobacterium quasiaquaticum]MDG0796025.1 AbrB/MazE/SpoVT family DNA-binding domain-containing protein [Pectobacterium punjabense]
MMRKGNSCISKTASLTDDVKDADTTAIDHSHITTSSGEGWDSWFATEDATSDFMEDREQPKTSQT